MTAEQKIKAIESLIDEYYTGNFDYEADIFGESNVDEVYDYGYTSGMNWVLGKIKKDIMELD